jgi:hypothetical protein
VNYVFLPYNIILLMEELIKRLAKGIQIPIFIIIILLAIVVIMYSMTTFKDYWTGKLAKANYEAQFGTKKS